VSLQGAEPSFVAQWPALSIPTPWPFLSEPRLWLAVPTVSWLVSNSNRPPNTPLQTSLWFAAAVTVADSLTVTYEDPFAAPAAVDWFNGKEFHGTPISVSLAETKGSTRGGASSGPPDVSAREAQPPAGYEEPAKDQGYAGGEGRGGGGMGRGGALGSQEREQDEEEEGGRGGGQDGDWPCPNPRSVVNGMPSVSPPRASSFPLPSLLRTTPALTLRQPPFFPSPILLLTHLLHIPHLSTVRKTTSGIAL